MPDGLRANREEGPGREPGEGEGEGDGEDSRSDAWMACITWLTRLFKTLMECG